MLHRYIFCKTYNLIFFKYAFIKNNIQLQYNLKYLEFSVII